MFFTTCNVCRAEQNWLVVARDGQRHNVTRVNGLFFPGNGVSQWGGWDQPDIWVLGETFLNLFFFSESISLCIQAS